MLKASIYELRGPRDLTLREEPVEPPGPQQLVAATRYSVVSTGTELAAWSGKPPLRPSVPYPRVVGYCNLAEVVEVGTDVSGLGVGDLILTHQSHRSAFRCDASQVLWSARQLSDELAARVSTAYLFHLGYVALLQGGFVPGVEVAVIGLGALGYCTAELAAAGGASPVVFSSSAGVVGACVPRHTRLLRKEYAPEAFTPRQKELGGFDLVVCTSDAWSDYRLSLELARKGGEVVLLGFPGRGSPMPDFNPLDSRYLYDKQLTVRQVGHVTEGHLPPIDARFTLARNVAYLTDLIAEGRIDAEPLIRYRVVSDRLAEVYTSLGERRVDSHAALLEWKR